MDSEQELIDALDRVVHKDFPNPQRIDCPGTKILLKLVMEPKHDQFRAVLAHITQCAPCFDELREIRRAAKGQNP
jgi:hypothetical protein